MRTINKQNTAKYSFVVIAAISVIFLGSLPAESLSRQSQSQTRSFANQPKRDTVANFKLENVAGGFMTSEDLRGKVAVVDLWATWCALCVHEIPIYKQLYNSFEGQNVAIVGIAVDSPRRDIPSKIRQLGIEYPILISDDQLKAFGPIQVFPTTVVISKEGKIYSRYVGNVPQKEKRIQQDVERLLSADDGTDH
jgi:thiol-disulfide isomerase/thioredoxin